MKNLNYIIIFISSLSSLTTVGQSTNRSANSNQTTTTYQATSIPFDNGSAFDKLKFTRAKDQDFGRESYEIIDINLIKKRTNGSGSFAPSLPFDVPFYLEGDISKDVKSVYAIALPKVKCKNNYDIINTLNVIVNEYNKLQIDNRNTSDKTNINGHSIYINDVANCVNCLQDKVLSNLVNDRIKFDDWAKRKASTGTWNSIDTKYLRVSDSLNSYSILMEPLESGTEYEIFLYFITEISEEDKLKLKNDGIRLLFSTLHTTIGASKRDKNNLREASDLDHTIDKIHTTLKPKFIKKIAEYGIDNEKLVSKYNRARDEFLPQFKTGTLSYMKAVNDLHVKDQLLDSAEFEIVEMASTIRCPRFQQYLMGIQMLDKNTGGFSNLKGIRTNEKGEVTDFLDINTRKENIHKLIMKIKSDRGIICDLSACCTSEEERNKLNIVLKQIISTSVANLRSVENYENSKKVYLQSLGLISEILLDSLVPNNEPISLNSDSHSTFRSRSGAFIIPEFGVMLTGSKEYGMRFTPSFGLNFHLGQINREHSYSLFKSSNTRIRKLKSISMSVGFTFLNDFDNDRRQGIIKGIPTTLYSGLGFRVHDVFRIGMGANFSRIVSANVLENKTKLHVEPYLQVSIDFSASDFFNNIFGWIL